MRAALGDVLGVMLDWSRKKALQETKQNWSTKMEMWSCWFCGTTAWNQQRFSASLGHRELWQPLWKSRPAAYYGGPASDHQSSE